MHRYRHLVSKPPHVTAPTERNLQLNYFLKGQSRLCDKTAHQDRYPHEPETTKGGRRHRRELAALTQPCGTIEQTPSNQPLSLVRQPTRRARTPQEPVQRAGLIVFHTQISPFNTLVRGDWTKKCVDWSGSSILGVMKAMFMSSWSVASLGWSTF